MPHLPSDCPSSEGSSSHVTDGRVAFQIDSEDERADDAEAFGPLNDRLGSRAMAVACGSHALRARAPLPLGPVKGRMRVGLDKLHDQIAA
jgi:hypothetical protein